VQGDCSKIGGGDWKDPIADSSEVVRWHSQTLVGRMWMIGVGLLSISIDQVTKVG